MAENIQGKCSARTMSGTAVRRTKRKGTKVYREEGREDKRKCIAEEKLSYRVGIPSPPTSPSLLVLGWFSLRCRIGHPKGDFRSAASDGGCPIVLVPQWQCAGPVHAHARQTRRATHRADRTHPILSRTTNDGREV